MRKKEREREREGEKRRMQKGRRDCEKGSSFAVRREGREREGICARMDGGGGGGGEREK